MNATPKIILILAFTCASIHNYHAQSAAFKAAWAKMEDIIRKTDSAAVFVQMQNRKKLKLSSHNSDRAVHNIKFRYKDGNIMACHTYKLGAHSRIKLLAVNGQPVTIWCKYKDGKLTLWNRFKALGDKTWYWTGQTNNFDEIARLEIVKNWQ